MQIVALEESGSRTRVKHLFLAVAIAMNCRTFQFYPGMSLVQELWIACCFFFLVTIYPLWKAKSYWRLSRLELYLLLLILIVPAVSAFCAWEGSRQPLTYGFAAHRGVALFGFVLAIAYGLRRHLLNIEDIERSLLVLSWGTLILYTGMQLFLRPSEFTRYGIGFVSGPGELAEFKLQSFFTVFGFFYYVFRGFRIGGIKNYSFALLFATSSIGRVGGRALTVSLTVVVLFFFYRWGRARFLLITLPKMLVFLVTMLSVLYAFESEAFSARFQKFSDAFRVAFTRAEVEDPSAASRALQVLIALPQIEAHPIFGTGLISNQWQRHRDPRLSNSFFPADYFFPSDIGLIGVLYLYGVFGLVLFAWQYLFALMAITRVPEHYHTPLLDATKGFLLFSVFNSITTGNFVFSAEVTLLFIVLLRAIAEHSSDKIERSYNHA